MPDETAVLETEVLPETPAEEPAEAPAEEPQDEEKVPDLSALKGLKPAQLRVLIDEADPEARAEIEAEYERRATQRAQTRSKEADTAETGRHNFYQQAIELGKQAEADLQTRARRFKAGDTEAFQDEHVLAAIDAYRTGGVASLVLQNEQSLAPIRDKYLPDLAPDEAEQLEKVLYEDRRSGKLTQLPVLMELVAARAKAAGFEEGLKKGTSDKQAKKELAEKLEKIEQIRAESAPGLPRGKPASVQTQRDAYARAVAQFKQDVNSGRLSQQEMVTRNAELDAMHAKLPRS